MPQALVMLDDAILRGAARDALVNAGWDVELFEEDAGVGHPIPVLCVVDQTNLERWRATQALFGSVAAASILVGSDRGEATTALARGAHGFITRADLPQIGRVARQVLQLVERLAAIRADMIAELGDRIEEISAAVEKARVDGGAAAVVRRLAHALRGAAGSVGLDELARVVGAMEERIPRDQPGPVDLRVELSALRVAADRIR